MTQLSGKIHNKGFLILSGYLHGKYGQDKPLSLSASIGFEQSYVEIDGNSVSSRSFPDCPLTRESR